jgi:hypothetical protein
VIVEIDDAGTGDIVGDAVIGFYISEQEEFIFRNIPVSYFQHPLWEQDFPMKYTVEIIENVLSELKFNQKSDLIHICSGNIFNLTRDMFKEKKIQFKDMKIEGKLQDAVEQALLDHLKSIGVNSKITIESGKKRFFQLFNWVSNNFPKRRKLVKSGFKSWGKKWESVCIEKYQKNKNNQKRTRSNYNNNQKPKYRPFS